MGNCFSRYDSVMIRKTKITVKPDGTCEEYKETTHSRNIENDMMLEDLEQIQQMVE